MNLSMFLSDSTKLLPPTRLGTLPYPAPCTILLPDQWPRNMCGASWQPDGWVLPTVATIRTITL